MQNNQEIPVERFAINPKQITAQQNASDAVKKIIECDGKASELFATGETPTRSLQRAISRDIYQSMDSADKNRD